MPDSPRALTRREMIALTGQLALAGALGSRRALAASEQSADAFGAIVGDPIAAKAGEKVLREGGNAIDAAITAAFAAGICSPSKCGVGGYGGHAIVARGGKITAIDFNTTAPAAARPDMFPLDEKGQVRGRVNFTGWLAAGVPGTVAGLELALRNHGTRSLRDVLGPAIVMCEEGVYVAPVAGMADSSHNDPRPEAAQKSKAPVKQRNLPLAALLTKFAARNTAESFYRGDVADMIVADFQRHGGLVTREDFAAYQAKETVPVTLEWNGLTLHTAPITASGVVMLEAMAALKALDWPRLSAPERLHAKVEALRLAWADRLRTFGDPEQIDVPVAELLSPAHAAELAEKISLALREHKPVPLHVDPSHAGGTVNISAADRMGNLIAITLTHGGSYGARVKVEELGMWLGHGMSRFDPRPGLPNSVGPRKRPMDNMSPTLVTRGRQPVLAAGAAGGTRIPNSVFEVLVNYAGLGAPLEAAMASPRLDANGTVNIGVEKTAPAEDEALLAGIGYKVSRVASAYVSAVEFDPAFHRARGMAAGGA